MSWRQRSRILVVVASGETPCLMFRKHINDLNHEEKRFWKYREHRTWNIGTFSINASSLKKLFIRNVNVISRHYYQAMNVFLLFTFLRLALHQIIIEKLSGWSGCVIPYVRCRSVAISWVQGRGLSRPWYIGLGQPRRPNPPPPRPHQRQPSFLVCLFLPSAWLHMVSGLGQGQP